MSASEIKNEKPDIRDQQTERKVFDSKEINWKEIKNGTFINVSDCLYFYQRGGRVILTKLLNNTEQIEHYDFNHEPITDKMNGGCHINETSSVTFLSIRFKLYKDGKETENTIRINGTFINNGNEFWELEKMFARFQTKGQKDKNRREYKFDCKHLETPIGFSYSCKSFTLHAPEIQDEKRKITLIFNNLQIQPFYNGKVFAESFDCSTLFTLGSWMGLVVMSIFTMVVAGGAYSLLSIKTMDRFDNTKGKSIINIAAGDQ